MAYLLVYRMQCSSLLAAVKACMTIDHVKVDGSIILRSMVVPYLIGVSDYLVLRPLILLQFFNAALIGNGPGDEANIVSVCINIPCT